MSTRILANGSIQTYDRVYASDLVAVANFYRQWFSVPYTAPSSGRIHLSDFIALRSAIAASIPTTGSVTYSVDGLPTFSSGKILMSTWPSVKSMFGSATFEYTTPGTYPVSVPVGASVMTVYLMIRAGGCLLYSSPSPRD